MNRDEKAAVIENVAREMDAAEAVFAVDYRGISVKQSAQLRRLLEDAGASFTVVKNRLGKRAADQSGAEALKAMLEGPTALTFVRGDAALAAKELAAFRREHGLLVFKGGTMNGDTLSADDVDAISRLPGRDVLYGQLVGITASPLTGLVRGLAGLISGVARQLQQIREQGLVGGEGSTASGASAETGAIPTPADDADAGAGGDASAEAGGGESADGTDEPESTAEAPGDPVSEAAAAEEESAGGDEAAAESGSEN